MSSPAPPRPWVPGTATGIGSWPGTDPAEAVEIIFGELPDLPHLPELPARGPGADMIGRGALFLADLSVQIEPSGWRFTARPGADARRARDFLARDLDALQRHADWTGPVKIQSAGPITLAASIELGSGHRAISDAGAVRDLAESLREGLGRHLADVAARLPGATRIVLQLDEPSLPAALAGQIPTPSGYGTVRAVASNVAEDHLRLVMGAVDAGARVVHCCSAGAPIAALVRAGADAVALDLDRLQRGDLDALGEAIDAGISLWLGALSSDPGAADRDPADRNVAARPSENGRAAHRLSEGERTSARDASGRGASGRGGDSAGADAAAVTRRITRIWDQLGFAPELLAGSVVPTPACGLAGSTPAAARAALSVLREVGQRLAEHA